MSEIFPEGTEPQSTDVKKLNILSRAWRRTRTALGNLGRSTIEGVKNSGKNVGTRFSNWQARRRYAAELLAEERHEELENWRAEQNEAALRADADEAHRSRQVTLGENYNYTKRGGSRKTRKINKTRKNIRTRKINKRIKTNRIRRIRRTSRKRKQLNRNCCK